MTCSTCGNALAQDARFCPKCGGQIPLQPAHAYAAAPYGLPYDRASRNLQTLGTLWLVYAVLRAITGMIGVLFLAKHRFAQADAVKPACQLPVDPRLHTVGKPGLVPRRRMRRSFILRPSPL